MGNQKKKISLFFRGFYTNPNTQKRKKKKKKKKAPFAEDHGEI